MDRKTTMLLLVDGYGINESEEGNAVKQANINALNDILKENPNTIIHTSGVDVGLPQNQVGDSAVGYSSVGLGRIQNQNLKKINDSIESGDFFSNPAFVKAIENCKNYDSKLHIMGLVSDGGVHSHNRHLYALLELCSRKGFEDVYIHAFLDGRDTLPASSEKYIAELEEKLNEKHIGKIATISGRHYAMDRNNHWDRIQKVYDAMVMGKGIKNTDAISAIEESYQQDIFDEYIEPIVITNVRNEPIATIKEHDSVIFITFRADRARQITQAFVQPTFNRFSREFQDVYFVTMTQYAVNIPEVIVAYDTEDLSNDFGEYISDLGLSQLYISESESYSNLNMFFINGKDINKKSIFVSSLDDDKYELKPEMSCFELTDRAIEAIESQKYDVIIMSLTNADVVAHTGNFESVCRAIEDIEKCIVKIVKTIKQTKSNLLMTATHGNCEQMIDYDTGEPNTANTTNPVPLVLISPMNKKVKEGRLSDIAPTMLELMGIDKPEEMTGESLLID